jgi:hypothetical protein
MAHLEFHSGIGIEGLVVRCRLGLPLLYADELYYLGNQDDLMNFVSRPYRNITSRASEYDLKGDCGDNVPFYTCLSHVFMCSSAKLAGKRDCGKAYVQWSQVFLALLAYKDRFGRYPKSIGELRSGLDWRVPEDIFSGKDFVYIPKRQGFLLYSFGQNLVDNGGLDEKKHPGVFPLEKDKHDDIIWRMEK